MSSTPPRNPTNNNNNPPPLVRSRISGIIADDDTPPVDLTPVNGLTAIASGLALDNLSPLPISFPSFGININNNSSLVEFEKQLKSSYLSQQDKISLINEADLSDTVKQRLIKTHIFDPKLLIQFENNPSGGTKRKKTKRRKTKRKKTKRRKYKK
jgi:hypothetical protein